MKRKRTSCSSRYESDRASNSGSGRYYRESNYQQQEYGDNNYENNNGRRSTNYPTRNGHRGRRGYGSTGNSYRGGTQSDAGTGGEHRLAFFARANFSSQMKRVNVEISEMFRVRIRIESIEIGRHKSTANNSKRRATVPIV